MAPSISKTMRNKNSGSRNSSETTSTTVTAVVPVKKSLRYRQNMERAAFICTLLFCSSIAFGIWYTDGALVSKTVTMLRKMEPNATQSRNPAVICADSRNKNTPFCQERAATTEANWSSMSRVQGGKSSQFSLHGDRSRR